MKRLTEDEIVGRHRRLRGVILGKLQEIVEDRGACHAAVHAVGHDSATEQQTTIFVNDHMPDIILSVSCTSTLNLHFSGYRYFTHVSSI